MDSEFKLYIYPDDSDYQGDVDDLITQLIDLELAGSSLYKNRYEAGENFLSLLIFMGCSPDIELEPQDDKPYCYIEVNSGSAPVFISGKNTKYPNCKNCKERLKTLVCSNCNEALDVANVNWRKSAFSASCWICIGNIYELEAIPSDILLDSLEDKSGVKWKPAYIRNAVHLNG